MFVHTFVDVPTLPIFCGAEECHPGVEDIVVRRRRQVHGLREAG